MSMSNYEEWHNDLIRQVRAIGESLIKNAESIVGTEKLLRTIDISAMVAIDQGDIPEIVVTKTFSPGRYMEDSIEGREEDHEWWK